MRKSIFNKSMLTVAVTLSIIGISKAHADCELDPWLPECGINDIPQEEWLALGVAFEPVLDENENSTGAVIPVITTLDFMTFEADLFAYGEAVTLLEQDARALTENDLGAEPVEYQFTETYSEFSTYSSSSVPVFSANSRAYAVNVDAANSTNLRSQRYTTDSAYVQAIDDFNAHSTAYYDTYGTQVDAFFNAAPQRADFTAYQDFDEALLTYMAGFPVPTVEKYHYDYISNDPILSEYIFDNQDGLITQVGISNRTLVFYGADDTPVALAESDSDFDRAAFAYAAYQGLYGQLGMGGFNFTGDAADWYSIQDFTATIFEAAYGYGKTDFEQEDLTNASETQARADWFDVYNAYFDQLFQAEGITPPQEADYVEISNEMRLGGISDPINDTDATNKRYVDNAVSNIEMNGNPYVAVDGDTPAEALGENSIAIGNNARALMDGGVAIGDNALAESDGSVAIGAGAYAKSSVAVGAGAQATGNKTTAIGDNAVASGAQAVAVGNEATASGDDSVAIGNNATASGTNSVAIGANTSTSRDNTVSIGGRTLSDVARPVHGTDAANKAYVDEQIDISQMLFLGDANAYTDRQINALDKKLSAGIAAMAAQPSLPALVPGESAVAVGTGHYNGQSALGIGFGYARDANTQFYGGISAGTHSSAKPVFRAGASWKF